MTAADFNKLAAANQGEQSLLYQVRRAELPEPVEQYQFCPSRKWRADFCWPGERLIVEVDGGVYTQGRHTRGDGYERDCEKLAMAVVLGYRVMRFTTGQVTSGFALEMIEKVLRSERA